MMEKIASDAYSQGAYEALQQMNVPGHIKQAAAQYLIKEAGKLQQLKDMGQRGLDAFRSMKSTGANPAARLRMQERILARSGVGSHARTTPLASLPDADKAAIMAAKAKDALITRRIRLGAGGGATLGGLALGAGAMRDGGGPEMGDMGMAPPAPAAAAPGLRDRFNNLSTAQKALLLGGGAAAVGGLGYLGSQLT
jgi:hypothetical protein